MSTSAEVLDTLPAFLVDLLNHCPPAGSGVHQWLFKCAIHLLIHFDEQTTINLLLEKARDSGRPPERLEREVASQVRNALASMWLPKFPVRYALRRERALAFAALVRRSK
jgi:hypothetical protein